MALRGPAKPGMMDIKAKYKWDAWNELKGLSKEKAMEKYLAELDAITGAAASNWAPFGLRRSC